MTTDQPIGEMDEKSVRMMLWRVARDVFGGVPIEAQRRPDGGYTLSMNIDSAVIDPFLLCAECGKRAVHNFHRPDNECEDKAAHIREYPHMTHHPFTIGEPIHAD